MPAIHIFHRRTYIGGDDLQPSSLLTIFVRFLQLFGLILPLFIHIILTVPYNHNCDKNNNDNGEDATKHPFPILLLFYILFSLLYCVFSIYMEYKIIKVASLGTPTQPELRLPTIQTLLELRIGCFTFVNFLCVVLGCVCLGYVKSYYDTSENDVVYCNEDENDMLHRAWLAAPILLLLSQLAEVLMSVIGLIQLFSSHKRTSSSSSSLSSSSSPRQDEEFGETMLSSPTRQYAHHPLLDIPHSHSSSSSLEILSSSTPLSPSYPHSYSHRPHHELVEEMWSTRCQFWCKCLSLSTCYFFGGREIEHGDYGDISRVLADYFEHNGVLDLVPSDLMVGFGMLHRVQRQRILEARKSVLEERDCLERGGVGGVVRHPPPPPAAVSRSSSGVNIGGGVVCDETLLGTTASSAAITSSPAISPPNSGGIINGILLEDNASTIMTISRDGRDDEEEASYRDDDDNTADTNKSGCHHDDALSFRMTMSPRGSSRNNTATNVGNNGYSTNSSNINTNNNKGNNEVWYEPNRRSTLTKTNLFDLQTMEEGARFARFALAIYTWVLYVYMHPMTGLCQLGVNRCKLITDKKSSDSENVDERNTTSPIIGDNCFGAHHAALLSHIDVSSLSASDIRYAQCQSSLSETPYCIIVDHQWSSVVLSIRGTLSLEDCVKDVLVDPVSLEDLGREFGFDGEGQYCHCGVLDCTRWVYDDLQRHGILEQLLGDNAEFPNYKLRIVGHSLGAGCAVLLSYMMRQTYPTLRCLSYSPPGMFISWKLATECRDFVTSYVLDSDFIPRLSVQNMEHLRNEVLDLIGRIKVPKIEVVRTLFSDATGGEDGDGCGKLFCCCIGETHHGDVEYYAQVNDDMLHPRGSIPQNTDFARQLEQFNSIQSERKRHRGGLREVKLFPPGRIVHLVKTGQRKSCLHGLGKCITCGMTNVGSEYTPIWAENDDFNEVVINPTMWTDHFPNRVCLEIEKVATNAFGLNANGGGGDQRSGRNEGVRTLT